MALGVPIDRPSSVQPTSADIVVITAKRLDSDEAIETAISVETPSTEIGRRVQLSEFVGELYPNAEFRSFANDAATFLDHKVLVIAIYQRAGKGSDAEDAEGDDSQQQLFAA
jgi:CRISPR/Cas system-associated endoribonuclease Cas2